MEEKKRRCCCGKKTKQTDEALREFPGVAVNRADDNADTTALEKERTRTLNNNPRNSDS
ncbi:MAG: hypothetical protein K2G01_01230 [Paramuribaculum sp.]|nr:hypothetical protein [Paramuribaculum sp.]